MLYFTRWKALAIILTALIVCLFAVPNFFPQERVKTWPVWAQRHIVLGLDLQGGSYLLLEVDSNYVKKEKLDQVRDEVRRVLRDAKIGYTGLAVRGDAVEVRVKEGDQLYLTETPDGFRLTPYDPDFAKTMEVAEGFMSRYKNALRDLAR